MARATYLLYGLVAYAIFFTTFLYLVAFVGALPGAPVTVDWRGSPLTVDPGPGLPVAIAIDLALIALFGIQHSVMARPGFKAGWSRIVPGPIERSTYVLAASLVLILMFLLWRPIPETIWRVDNALGSAVLWALFALGWLTVLISTFLISHFELFGLSQVWGHARGTRPAPPVFRQPFFYRHVRHPIYSGFLLAFWATPHMTAGHLLLAAGITVYILIAIRYEERDLVGLFGEDYEAYRERVGMLTPRFRGRRAN
jgi:protein-S-isoprenylcysteine O-methyltransferase Ste14